MIPIGPDGLIVAAYLAIGSIFSLIGFAVGIFSSKKFRQFVSKQKFIALIVVLGLIKLASPPFVMAYHRHQQEVLHERLAKHVSKYTVLAEETTIKEITFPKGTRFYDWFIDYCNDEQFEFTEVSFPHETLYHGVFVNHIKRNQWNCWNESIILSRPQIIEGWLCAAGMPISFAENNATQLEYCRLSKDVLEIGNIRLPKSKFDSITVEHRMKNIPPVWVVYGDKYSGRFYGLKFASFFFTLSPDRNRMTDFSGTLAENSVIGNTEFTKGDTIGKDIMLEHIKNSELARHPP